MYRFVTVIVFIIEVLLSHAPGSVSGNQSKWLSDMTGVKEGLLRRLAHVVLFALLSFTAGAAWSWYGIGATLIWAGFFDEKTKEWIPGRHFSWFDCGLNLVGCLVGMALWLLLRT